MPHQLPNLSEFDEDDQNREVYAWAGLALYFAQVFEQALIHCLYACQLVDGSLAKEFSSADEFHTLIDRQTAGGILSRLRHHFGLSPQAESLCNEALRLRNFLIHKFFAERIELFLELEGRQLMLAELHAAVGTFQEVDRQLEELMFEQGKHFGLTRERVEEVYEAVNREARPGGRPSAEVVEEIMRKAGGYRRTHGSWERDS